MGAMRASAQRLFALRLALAACVSLLASSGMARAQASLDTAHDLPGVALDARLAVLPDLQGALTIRDVTSPALLARFVPVGDHKAHFDEGATAYWLRLPVQNGSAVARTWLLELAQAQVDELRLYVPNGSGGFSARIAGDNHPFAQRDLAYRHPVFALEEPPRSARTYFLRVSSADVVRVPLVAWTLRAFIEHQHLDWAALCMFYGVVLVMIAYNALVYAFTRQREYLPYVGFVFSLGALQFTIAGHTFQFLLPEHPAQAHALLPATLSATLLFACWLMSAQISGGGRELRVLQGFAAYFAGWIALSAVVPQDLAVRTLVASALLPLVNSIWIASNLLRRGSREAAVFMASWSSTVIGSAVYIAQSRALIPTTPATTWSIQIGLALQLVLVSSALADKINGARGALAAVNAQLSSKVSALSAALARAEEATQRAQRATRVKDDFMATMSHEFRTPLNPIINIPQGILEKFARTRYAMCERCRSHFELEVNELIGEETACPECAATGALVERVVTRFAGDPLRARRFLEKVERSGAHLLRVVNGILDFSKMEAGHLKLVRERLDLAALARGLVSEQAGDERAQRVQFVEGSAERAATVEADPERIRQVLAQLIDNGLKFSESPSPVSVRVSALEEGCLIEVADQGIGIAEEFRESIFESFEQVHKGNTRRYGGAGIGLSISRSLVRMHGGDMWVHSELGRGSTFYVLVPHALGATSSLRRSA